MKKYMVNIYGNNWVERDSAESAAQEVTEI